MIESFPTGLQYINEPTLDRTTARKITRNISGALQISWAFINQDLLIQGFWSECLLGVSNMVLDHSTTTQTVLRGRDGWWLESFLDRYLGWEKPYWIRGNTDIINGEIEPGAQTPTAAADRGM